MTFVITIKWQDKTFNRGERKEVFQQLSPLRKLNHLWRRSIIIFFSSTQKMSSALFLFKFCYAAENCSSESKISVALFFKEKSPLQTFKCRRDKNLVRCLISLFWLGDGMLAFFLALFLPYLVFILGSLGYGERGEWTTSSHDEPRLVYIMRK